MKELFKIIPKSHSKCPLKTNQKGLYNAILPSLSFYSDLGKKRVLLRKTGREQQREMRLNFKTVE